MHSSRSKVEIRGKIIYFNDRARAVDYFSGIGFRTPSLSNPCDYFMTIMSMESIEVESDEFKTTEETDAAIAEIYDKRIEVFVKSYEDSPLRTYAVKEAD